MKRDPNAPRHSWVKRRIPAGFLMVSFRYPNYNRTVPKNVTHCCKCGASTWMEKVPDRTWRRRWFRHLDDIWRSSDRVPACQGLPRNYDPPLGG